MGRMPCVNRTPEEKWRSFKEGTREATSRRRVGSMGLLPICSIGERMKPSRERRQRWGEKRCRGGNGEGPVHVVTLIRAS
jgi:hypothetical protein